MPNAMMAACKELCVFTKKVRGCKLEWSVIDSIVAATSVNSNIPGTAMIRTAAPCAIGRRVTLGTPSTGLGHTASWPRLCSPLVL